MHAHTHVHTEFESDSESKVTTQIESKQLDRTQGQTRLLSHRLEWESLLESPSHGRNQYMHPSVSVNVVAAGPYTTHSFSFEISNYDTPICPPPLSYSAGVNDHRFVFSSSCDCSFDFDFDFDVALSATGVNV